MRLSGGDAIFSGEIPPQTAIHLILSCSSAKDLLSAHSRAHEWANEIRSDSNVTQIGERGWTLPWIVAAHDAIVRRLNDIKPKWDHDSPLTAGLPFMPPIMLEPGSISIQRETDDSVEVKLRSGVISAGALNLINKYFDRPLVIDKSKTPMNSSGLYHLVLVPASYWDDNTKESLKAAIDIYNAKTASTYYIPSMKRSVLVGRSVLKNRIGECRNVMEACSLANHLSDRVVAGEKITIEQSSRFFDDMLQTAQRYLIKFLEPITDKAKLALGREKLIEDINKAIRERAIANMKNAEDIAKAIALKVSKEV